MYMYIYIYIYIYIYSLLGVTLLDLCVSSLRRGHANLLCIVPILTNNPRSESITSRPLLCDSKVSFFSDPPFKGVADGGWLNK